MEIKAGKIFEVWQDGVKITELSLEERKIPLFVEPEPVKRGRWMFRQYDANPKIGNYHCSECGCLADKITNYCPNCGARMEVENG